jgi:DNA primase
MARTYLSSIKYEIRATYDVAGVVEKPDIVGAIFGQSEGLLGEDMDLKELQQNGKIGRIEISVNKGKGKTSGEITIPSSLDRVKTSILAAAMETVEKVGPCEAHVKVNKIVDTRKEKREVITDRAQQLLKQMMKFEGAESDELAETIKSNIRIGKVVEYRGLTAGPEVETSPSIIVVEGRADVLKLLSYGINSVVAMDGSNISPQLIELCKEKEVTVLVDGDRGGQLNAEKLSQLTKVDYVAVAPDGKEVEELAQKEILQALKRRRDFESHKQANSHVPERRDERPYPERREYNDRRPNNHGYPTQRDNYNNRQNSCNNHNDNRGYPPRREYNDRQPTNRYPVQRDNYNDRRPTNNGYSSPREGYNNRRGGYGDSRNSRPYQDRGFGRDRYNNNPRESYGGPRPTERRFERNDKPRFDQTPKNDFMSEPQFDSRPEAQGKVPEEILALGADMNKLKGSLKARLYDDKKKKIKDVDVKDLLDTISKTRKKIDTIAFDGIVTKRLVDAAEAGGVKNIVGVRKGRVSSEKIGLYTL